MDRVIDSLDGSSTILDRMNQLRFDYRREHGLSTLRGAGLAFLLTFTTHDRLLAEVATLLGPCLYRREDWRQGSRFYFGIPIYSAPLTFGLAGSPASDVRLMSEAEVLEILNARGWGQWERETLRA